MITRSLSIDYIQMMNTLIHKQCMKEKVFYISMLLARNNGLIF